jgi:hypothetical protein
MTTAVSPSLTSLRDPLPFPSFESCPHENYVSQPYFRLQRGVYTASRHWCFLGEITDTTTMIRLRLWVRDKDGESMIPIAFHLDAGKGSGFRVIMPDDVEVKNIHPNLPDQLIKKGNTIAVLYAQQHNFFDGTIGLRIEDADFVQVRALLSCLIALTNSLIFYIDISL